MNNPENQYTDLLTDLPAEETYTLSPYSMNKVTLIPPLPGGLSTRVNKP